MSDAKPPGQLRIIGGQWRGRKFPILGKALIRPTPDRIRETLFNWLQNHIRGARCLDLFAGSGMLGLEALSRGAGFVHFIEQDQDTAIHIRSHLERLGAMAQAHVQTASVGQGAPNTAPFDIVFVDPPFDANLIEKTLAWLQAEKLIHAGSLIYIEYASTYEPALEPPFTPLKSAKAGHVRAQLIES